MDKGKNRSNRTEATSFGTSIIALFVGLFFVFCPWYIGPYPEFSIRDTTIPVQAIIQWIFYLLGAVCFIFAFGFWGVAMRNSPQMGQFLKAFWGGGEEGWQYTSQSAVFLGIAFFLHLFFMTFLNLDGILEWIVEPFVIVALFFGVVMLGFACDSFFIKPTLANASSGEEKLRFFVEQVRKRATIIIPICIAIAAVIVELYKS